LRCFVDWSNQEIGELIQAGSLTVEKQHGVATMLERAQATVLAPCRSIEALQAIPELLEEAGQDGNPK
jgi:hypothetical protein